MFRSKGSYDEHRRAVHTDERAFVCDICNKSYKSYRVLKIHKLRHGPANEVCNICGKTFRLRSEVKHHMRRHNNDRRVQCESCDKVFYRNSELKNHQRIHTGEKPYKCKFCVYACTIKGNLDKHMKTHEKEANGAIDNPLRKQKVSAIINAVKNQELRQTSTETVTVSCKMDIGDGVGGRDTVSNVWSIPMNPQEHSAVQTIHQWQLKNYEIVQDPESLGQMSYPIPRTVQAVSANTESVEKTDSTGDIKVYASMQAPSHLQDKPPVTLHSADVIANATAVAGIQVILPDGQSQLTELQSSKSDTDQQWALPNNSKSLPTVFFQSIYPQTVTKSVDVNELPQWQQSVSKGQSELPVIPTVVQPLYMEVKEGKEIIKDATETCNWSVTSTSNQVDQSQSEANEIIIEGYDSNYF